MSLLGAAGLAAAAALLGGGLGVWLGWILRSARAQGLSALLESAQARGIAAESELASLRSRHESLAGELRALTGALAEARTELKHAQEGRESHEAMVARTRKEMSQEFENLANRLFDGKGQRLVVQGREQLQQVLGPFREQMSEFRKRVDDVHERGLKEQASLRAQLTQLQQLNQQLSSDATSLTHALRGESKAQGNWGELVLARILEASGLAEGREFETQLHLRDQYGGQIARFPDVVVHLPEQRDVIVDAKVSLTAYETFWRAETDTDRERAIKAHLVSVRGHVKELAAKRYDELEGIQTLDLVIMCIPNESAFVTAVSREPGLYEEAFRQHIMLVSPSTLLLSLRIIASLWRQEDQNRNAEEIALRGQRLLEKFVDFVKDLEGVGIRLRQADETYQQAHKRLTSGAGSLVRQAEMLQKLGVKSRKSLPTARDDEESSEIIDSGQLTP